VVPSQPGKVVPHDAISKIPSPKKAGGVAQGEGHEFKPQYCKKKKSNNIVYESFICLDESFCSFLF
jgi:hypothetical protein